MENEVSNVEEKECMLTTFDNPFNPFDDFLAWFLFDIEKGYNTCSYLARIVELEEDFTQQEINNEIERAIDEIIMFDPINLYQKVWKQTETA